MKPKHNTLKWEIDSDGYSAPKTAWKIFKDFLNGHSKRFWSFTLIVLWRQNLTYFLRIFCSSRALICNWPNSSESHRFTRHQQTANHQLMFEKKNRLFVWNWISLYNNVINLVKRSMFHRSPHYEKSFVKIIAYSQKKKNYTHNRLVIITSEILNVFQKPQFEDSVQRVGEWT